MNHLVELIKSFIPPMSSQLARDEAYLSEAVDIYDVERRIWEIDHRASQSQSLGGAVH
jgi:hypothetical protein